MRERNMPPTPECDRLRDVSRSSQLIGEFLEWLLAEYTLAEWNDSGEVLRPVRASIEELLAEYFGIDLDKIEEERQAVLEALQKEEG